MPAAAVVKATAPYRWPASHGTRLRHACAHHHPAPPPSRRLDTTCDRRYFSLSGVRPAALRIRQTGSTMIEIQIGEGDRIEWALKQFRRKMLRSGLFKDMKKKRFYEKPSEAKKRKAADARRRNARARRRR